MGRIPSDILHLPKYGHILWQIEFFINNKKLKHTFFSSHGTYYLIFSKITLTIFILFFP